MDIFAHGLWSVVAAKFAKRAVPFKNLNLGWAAFWGIAPDLFSFGILFIVNIFSNGFAAPRFIGPDGVPDPNLIPSYIHALYNITHSFFTFGLGFVIGWLILKRPPWEMFGWALHIFIDIFTHTSKFFPTPFLWPFFRTEFNGLSWATPWFLVTNYAVLLVVYSLLFILP